jgi:hypothetical protein
MFIKTLRALIVILCSATAFYIANIAPTATQTASGHGTGGGGGAGRG